MGSRVSKPKIRIKSREKVILQDTALPWFIALPVELYKIIASLVETLKCYQSLSQTCHNAALGCSLYIQEASKRSTINVQIIYNFTGHYNDNNWFYNHEPFPVTSIQLTEAVNRNPSGCDNKSENQRCSSHSRYYMEYRKDIVLWNGHQDWDIYKPEYDTKF
ncbi:Hypothetical protein POVR1_LOCUS223 [uncultured virus]|nr:Hypothetical protein POVR1_LOCUS223 [uncultured virus]